MRIGFLFIVVSGATSVDGRPMTGLCRERNLPGMSPRVAEQILHRIESECKISRSVECIQKSLHDSSDFSEAAVQSFTERVRNARMSVPPSLVEFLISLGASTGEPRDVGDVWAEFMQTYPDSTVACHTMASVYHAVSNWADALDPPHRLKPEFLGELMYLEIRQAALIPFSSLPTDSDIYTRFERDLELYTARRITRTGINDINTIRERVSLLIGRSIRFLGPSEIFQEAVNAVDTSHVFRYALQNWWRTVEVPDWLGGIKKARPVPYTESRYAAARSVLDGVFPEVLPTPDDISSISDAQMQSRRRALSTLVERIGVSVAEFDTIVRALGSPEPPPRMTPVMGDWIRTVIVPHAGRTIGCIGLVMVYWRQSAIVLPPRSLINHIISSAYPARGVSNKRKFAALDLLASVATNEAKKDRVSRRSLGDTID
jgi:hypothetical protein